MLYLTFALLLGYIPVNSDYVPPEEGIEIWVERDAMHTEIIIPANPEHSLWFHYLDIDEHQRERLNYISFGWGERSWYLGGGQFNFRTFPIVLKALFLPTKSVMHVNSYIFKPSEARYRIKVKVTAEQFDMLQQYIFNHFQITRDGVFDALGESVIGYGAFYEGRGSYHLFFTSNNWTSKIIKKMGVRGPLWAPLPHGIIYHLRKATRTQN
jgi:uncharacterized protein (TIGR02117 family)